MHKLSVAIITYNEESRIVACIQSVLPIADEVVVIDSFSTDKTVALAESREARVILNPFEGYAEQKNFALAQCQHPYILSLDADERLDEEAIQQIRALKEKGFEADGYILPRKSFIGNRRIRYGSWYPDKKVRLVQKGKACWKGKGVHESLVVESANIFTLQGYILHYSYQNTGELLVKTRKYAELAARYLHSQHKKISPVMVPVKALVRFIKHYFIKLGFLEGWTGFLIGRQQFYEAWWKYSGLLSLHREKTEEQKNRKTGKQKNRRTEEL